MTDKYYMYDRVEITKEKYIERLRERIQCFTDEIAEIDRKATIKKQKLSDRCKAITQEINKLQSDKLPNYKGLSKAKRAVTELYDKEPSEELLNIISNIK